MLVPVILGSLFALTVLIQPLVTYFIDRKGLRKYPGPFIAAITPWWIVFQSWSRQRYKSIDKLHARYGPVVRISPDHLSFADPTAFKEIHGHGVSLIKDDFYEIIGGGNPSMAQTKSRSLHSRKRRFMAHVFSPKEITAMEPRVQELASKLLRCLRVKAAGGMIGPMDAYPPVNGAFDLRPWLNMFSFDAITSMFWSNSYGLLEKGNDLCPALTLDGATYEAHAMASFHGTTSHVVPIAQLGSSILYKTMQNLLKYSKGQFHNTNFVSMVRYLVTNRLKSPPPEPDLFSSIPLQPTSKRPEPIPISEVMAECTTMLDAGNDTTQTSLTNCMYQLSLHPDTQDKLRLELISALSSSREPGDSPDPVQSYQKLQHVPYLRAVLDESFRCRPPVGFGLPRRTVEPTTINGHLIAKDVTVSAPLYNIHKDPSYFTRATEFIPERWLDAKASDYSSNDPAFPKERDNLRNYVVPFSLGGRACIGRNLAYMEISIVIAALVLVFDWRIAEEWHGNGKGMEVVERLNANPKECWVRATIRDGMVNEEA